MTEHSPRPDACELITADLERQCRARRTHFLPALLLALVVGVGTLVAVGTRPDLLEQGPIQLAALAGLWVLCLVIFPAIGVGLLFVGRTTRLALVAAGVLATVMLTSGWPDGTASMHVHGGSGLGCLPLTLGTGVLLLGIGFLSGAFVQRRAVASIFWVAAGLSLMALNVVTWHCPRTGLPHVLPHHLGGALALLVVAVIVGVLARRHGRARC